MSEQISTSLRMTELYHTLFPFLLDWSNSGGKTALHIAAQAGNFEFINLLCDLGADIDLTDLQGNTPLHYASAWGHLDTIKVLLERDCQFAARSFEGYTASDFSYSNTVFNSIQMLARERTRIRVDTGIAGRMRSGSGSTNASLGSASGQGRQAWPFPDVRSAPGSRRQSITQVSPPPPLPTSTYSSPSIRPAQLGQNPSSSSTYTSPSIRPAQITQNPSSSSTYSSPSMRSAQSSRIPSPPPPLPYSHSSFGKPPQPTPPQPYRSPSMPGDAFRPATTNGLVTAPGPPAQFSTSSAHLGSYALAPPLAGNQTLSPPLLGGTALPGSGPFGSIQMRRANSAQTGSSNGSGQTRTHRAESGTSGRGTPI